MHVQNDEFARHREQGDEQDHLNLDDVLHARDDVLQSVIELKRDHQRDDLAEHSLKQRMVERVQNAEHQRGKDFDDQPAQSHDDHYGNDQRERECHQAFEALVPRE